MSSVFRSLAALLPLALLTAAPAAHAAPAAAVGAKAKKAKPAKAAKVTIAKVTATGAKVTVGGTVALPQNTAKVRRRTTIALTLADAAGRKDAFTTGIDAKRRFTVSRTTKLTGDLGLTAQVRIGGKASGKRVVRTVSVAGVVKPGGTTPTPTPTTAAPPPTQPTSTTPTTPSVTPDPGTPLVGLFKLDAGKQATSGALSGTYFRMFGVTNGNSTALDQNYTLLRPGTDGGLRTDAFQVASAPAFAAVDPANPSLPSGDSLSNAIVLPQRFFNVDFSVVTDAVARGTNANGSLSLGSASLPSIVDAKGALSGQVTAWTAAWNGLWFNQGTPKPDGGLPGGTTALGGTYDAATNHFVLTWRSLIQGGPFDGFVGGWHLEGTFVPATR